jgi:hypothetical protein
VGDLLDPPDVGVVLMKLAQSAENAGNMAASSMYQRELQQMAHNVHRHIG